MSVDFFLKIDSIKGESMDANHKDEIRLHSWSWGASQVTSVHGTGGSGAGKASLSEISIMKDYDKASPQFFQNLLMGTHIDKAILTANKSQGQKTGQAFLTITLKEVYVTSQQVSGSSEIPSESVSFSYNHIEVDYKQQKEDGTSTSTGVVSYDLKANQAG